MANRTEACQVSQEVCLLASGLCACAGRGSESARALTQGVPPPTRPSSETQDMHTVRGFQRQGTMSAVTPAEWIPRPGLEGRS